MRGPMWQTADHVRFDLRYLSPADHKPQQRLCGMAWGRGRPPTRRTRLPHGGWHFRRVPVCSPRRWSAASIRPLSKLQPAKIATADGKRRCSDRQYMGIWRRSAAQVACSPRRPTTHCRTHW